MKQVVPPTVGTNGAINVPTNYFTLAQEIQQGLQEIANLGNNAVSEMQTTPLPASFSTADQVWFLAASEVLATYFMNRIIDEQWALRLGALCARNPLICQPASQCRSRSCPSGKHACHMCQCEQKVSASRVSLAASTHARSWQA